MKGIDLCRHYYFDCVKPIIDQHCLFLNKQYSCGLFGYGSEVHRNDDQFSRDHEWGPRLVLLVDNISHIQCLSDILNHAIPPEFLGFKTRFLFNAEYGARIPSDNGFVNIEIHRYDEYIASYTAIPAPESDLDWLCIAENKLFELTGGEIFYDYQNILADKIAVFKSYYPLNVWKYRLAGLWQMISWNVDIIGLCDARNDNIFSKLALHKTLLPLIRLVSTYNRKYAPSYCKWIGTQFYKLPHLSNDMGPLIEQCLSTDNEAVIRDHLEKALQLIINFHNDFADLPHIEPYPINGYNRGFWNIDCMKISEVILNSIDGILSKIPLFGALDQIIVNEDILLNPELLARFRNIYTS